MFKGQKDREPNVGDPPASFKSPVLLDLFKLRPTKESQKLTKPKVFAKFAKGQCRIVVAIPLIYEKETPRNNPSKTRVKT